MAEYFEREALIGDLTAAMDHRGMGQVIGQTLIRYVKRQPTADVAPVVHGRWSTGRFNLETGNYEEQCTRCRNFSKEYDKLYCPNCGAKMDGGDSDAVN